MAKPRNRQNPEARRAEIIEQAIDAIGARGYYGFTLPDLARRCGLTNPGLLHHYPSKEHVLLAMLEQIEARERDHMQPFIRAAQEAAGTDADAARQAALAVFRAMVRRLHAQPRITRLVAELHLEALDPTHPAHGWWSRRLENTHDLFVALLRGFAPQAETKARLLLAMMDGFCLQWLQRGDALDIVGDWDVALAMLLPEPGPADGGMQ